MNNKMMMKYFKQLFLLVIFLASATAVAQKDSIAQQREARKLLRNGNELYTKEKYADAGVLYKKALDKNGTYKKASYNLGNSLFLQKDYKAAVPEYELSAKTSTDKIEKAASYHNIGNAMMKQNQYQQAIDAYKNALRNNPEDDKTRYNLAVAKEKLKKQQDKDNKDKKDKKKDDKDKKKNKDKKDDKGEKKNDPNSDQKDKDQKGKKNDQNKNQDKKDPSKQDQNKDNKNKEKPQQGKMTPEQVKQLLKSLNNEEKKTQKKMNAQKAKGTKTKNGKDW